MILGNEYSKITILGKTYAVTRSDTFKRKNAWAEIDYINQVIEIEKDITNEKAKEALLHEIVHGIFESLGFYTENENEHLIQCLANSLYQVLNDNNNLIIDF